jgi:hypothetical protein
MRFVGSATTDDDDDDDDDRDDMVRSSKLLSDGLSIQSQFQKSYSRSARLSVSHSSMFIRSHSHLHYLLLVQVSTSSAGLCSSL